MKNASPKPGSAEYPIEKPQDLQRPEFNSTSEQRSSEELPAVEHIEEESGLDEKEKNASRMEQQKKMPAKSDLGNDRDEEEAERERIIRR